MLLADEPTGALDSGSAQQVMQCFAKLRDSDKTIILVTHDEAVAGMCDAVVRLVYGKIA
ncbi:MAG: hypothetical protein PHI27_01875 [Eubacteriales bacterium]|nr:hypothetical protein [Eubacteriales bacterium]MDD3880980.1 hypothetical protein [Eubacteriales bacterium]MDD4511951.1 hypothetical protein [Eubacteriales bacterium]